MPFRLTIGNHVFVFDSLKTLMAKATPFRTGDALAGIAADSYRERVAAQMALADVPLQTFLDEALIPYEVDEVTRLIIESHDVVAFAPIASFTVDEFRDWLLSDAADTLILKFISPGITPEMAAAVSKVMRNQDLLSVARKCNVVTAFNNSIGLPGRFSVRLQPNHPTDGPERYSCQHDRRLDIWLWGCGNWHQPCFRQPGRCGGYFADA